MSRITLGNFLKNILLKPSYNGFRHFLLILFFLVISFNAALFTFQDDFASYNPPVSLIFIWGAGFTIMYLLFSYFILYSMIPKYLIKKKYTSFILLLFYGSIFLTFANLLFEYCILILYNFPLESFSLYTAQFPIIRLIFNFLIHFVCFGSLLITILLKNWFINTKRVHELEQLHLQRELEQLKGTINPSFLFSVLDYASLLAEKNPQQTSEIVIKLSKLLRYQLYESNKEIVLLSSEIQFLSNFMTLMKLLYKDFSFHITSKENLTILVPSLLYISLLEDFIKGVQNKEINTIYISFEEKDDILSFFCRCNLLTKQNNDWNVNVSKQRLNLLYNNQYDLKLQNDTSEYCLQLDIPV